MSYGLIFDMDGVLADTESLIARATIKMFRELYDAELEPEDFRPFIGTGAVRYVEGPAEKRGIQIDIDRAVQQRHENFVALLEAGECRACPGAVELIEAASEAGWKLAIATSSPREKAETTLNAAKIPLARFTTIVNGDMVHNKKPHPEIYETACAAIELRPGGCVVVEDAVTGVEAAKAAGASCIGVTSSFGPEELCKADLIVNSLLEVDVTALDKLVGKHV